MAVVLFFFPVWHLCTPRLPLMLHVNSSKQHTHTHTCRFPTAKLLEMKQPDSDTFFFNNSQPCTWASLHNLAICPGMPMSSELKLNQALTIRSMEAWDIFANLPPLFLFPLFLQYLFLLIWEKKKQKKIKNQSIQVIPLAYETRQTPFCAQFSTTI